MCQNFNFKYNYKDIKFDKNYDKTITTFDTHSKGRSYSNLFFKLKNAHRISLYIL